MLLWLTVRCTFSSNAHFSDLIGLPKLMQEVMTTVQIDLVGTQDFC